MAGRAVIFSGVSFAAAVTTSPSWDPFCPPPVSSDIYDYVPIEIRRSSRSPSLVLLSACIAAAAAFVVLLTAFLVFRRRRRRRQQQQVYGHPVVRLPINPGGGAAEDGDGPFFDQQQQQQHHVWLIRTVGLDDATIKGIAAWPYKSGEGIDSNVDCPVCLGEFRDGEMLKLLPKCSHVFHSTCVDTWLRSHVNCPLCRALVAPSKDESDNPTTETPTSLGEPPVDDLSEVSRMEIVIDPPLSVPAVIPENDILEEEVHPVEENWLQTYRRSVSMDSLPLDTLVVRVDSADDRRKMGYWEERVADRRTCYGGKKRLMGMKRTLSSSDRWLFMSKN